MKKRLNKQKEVSEIGEILRFINYIFIIIAAIFMFLLKIDTIAFLFIIICLINLFFINLYTKEIKLKRNNKITLKQNKHWFIVYQIGLVIGIIILILFELKLLNK